MVLHHVLKLTTWCTGSGVSWELQPICPGPPAMSYKVVCRWLLLVLGFEVLRKGQVANQGWLMLASASPGVT